MKHIQVIAYCDGTHDERTRAVKERTIKIDDGSPVMLDLCQTCDKVFLDMLAFMERGAPVEKPQRAAPRKKRDRTGESRPSRLPGQDEASRTCPECGHLSPNRSSLGQHTRIQHGKGLKDFPPEAFQKKSDEPG